jgi:photosystem II oxygen-evolving enhancer protein 1
MRYRALIAAFAAICIGILTACSDASNISDRPLTYEEIRNTGLADNCPEISTVTRGSLPVVEGTTYQLSGLCLKPLEFYVKEESVNKRKEEAFVAGRVLTRYTTTLDQIQGKLTPTSDGSIKFVEEDGFDFQAITVLLPGGEEVPFLFTIKGLVATSQPDLLSINSSTDFEGTFRVPSYRGATFLDPKGRGIASGYDNAVALPAQADSEELVKENVKSLDIGQGKISLQVTKVDADTHEISGTFVSVQPSDTDLGSKKPVDIKVVGRFYGLVDEAI